MPRQPALGVLSCFLLAALSVPRTLASQEAEFRRCIANIRAAKSSRTIKPATWQLLDSLAPDNRVVGESSAQPEFRLPVWDYVAVMVDDERIADGRERLREHRATFDAIAERFGVEAEVVAAVWGIESDFGRNRGGYSVLRSLATLSCTGRRQTYFRHELRSALRIVQNGHVQPDSFRGSWAGAFGQTQFMPGSFERLAVDFDRDGRRDVIGNPADALGSAANYLRNAGWRPGRPWGIEVRLPRPGGKPFALAREGRRVQRSLATWKSRGLTRIDGSPLVGPGLEGTTTAGLLAPAGAGGPAFLVFRNFTAIYRYNASEHYSLSVVHLADRLRGAEPFATPWPTGDGGLSRAERRELQMLLAARGHEVGPPTRVLTPLIRAAVKVEQGRLGQEATGRPGQRLLRDLRGLSSR
jgi:lytic murein transglycosylase